MWPKTDRGIKLFKEVVAKAGQFDEEGLMREMKTVTRDNYRFSQDDEEESSIFVEPYMSVEGGERKTKTSTFMLVTRQGDKRELVVKEVTYGKEKE